VTRLDILNLEWPDSDRDLHIVTPSLVYLNKKYNIQYKTKSIFNACYYLLKYKPKMIIIASYVGAGINLNIANIAKFMNIKLVTLISEGNFKKDELDLYLFGSYGQKQKKIIADRYLLWNTMSYNLIKEKYNNLINIFSVVGGTGFDRYKLLEYKNKQQFLIENDMKYKHIIGIAGWAFGIMFNNDKEYYINMYGEEQVEMHQKDLQRINAIYEEIIESNKNILFILRYHPVTCSLNEDEFCSLEKYKNVFISNKYKNQNYQISDLINISDLWIGYETTTALEAWLLNKQTFLINPTRSDFIRENVHKGSPIVKTTKEAQNLINEFFDTGTMKSFDKLESNRDEIIKDVIEYVDGKNHIRAADEIMKVYNKPDKTVKYGFKIYKEASKQILKLILSKTIMKKRWPELKYESDFAKPYQDMYDKAINV